MNILNIKYYKYAYSCFACVRSCARTSDYLKRALRSRASRSFHRTRTLRVLYIMRVSRTVLTCMCTFTTPIAYHDTTVH